MKNNQEAKVNLHTSRETHHQHHTIYKFILQIQYIYNKQNQRKKSEYHNHNKTLQVVQKWGMAQTVYPLIN
jgi:hypothetical protein